MNKQDQLAYEQKLKGRVLKVYNLLKAYPHLRQLQNENDLIISYWNTYDGYTEHGNPLRCTSHQAISRAARRVRAAGFLDTSDNIDVRAYIEQAYRNTFKS